MNRLEDNLSPDAFPLRDRNHHRRVDVAVDATSQDSDLGAWRSRVGLSQQLGRHVCFFGYAMCKPTAVKMRETRAEASMRVLPIGDKESVARG